MGLIVPRWGFKHHASWHTQNGQTVSDAEGQAITCSASANTKGNTSTVLTAVDFDVHCIAVGFAGANLAGASRACLADVMYDPAGGTSWSVLIPNLLHGQSLSIQALVTHQEVYVFPVYVPSGASFGVRGQCINSGSVVFSSVVWVWGEPSRPEMWWCGQAVEAVGPNTATSLGVAITPTDGAYTSWTTLGTSVRPFGAFQMGIGPSSDSNQLARNLNYQIGVGGSQLPGSPTYRATTEGTNERRAFHRCMVPLCCDIPGGTTFQMRVYSTGGAQVDAQCFAVYGVY